jgi:NAD(P) transhydrogenase subunit alpha
MNDVPLFYGEERVKICIVKEMALDERRVAGTPETVKKFKALGADVAVEAGAGLSAALADADYAAMGATLADRAATVADADIILGV